MKIPIFFSQQNAEQIQYSNGIPQFYDLLTIFILFNSESVLFNVRGKIAVTTFVIVFFFLVYLCDLF